MGTGRFAAVITSVTCMIVASSAGPAAAGGYCLTAEPGVQVYAEPRLDSRVVWVLAGEGQHFECSRAADRAWLHAKSEDDIWGGFVETRLAVSNSG